MEGTYSKIQWSEASYRQCASPRAVLISDDHKVLHYCQTSPRTLAIYHVWSHGHGGRPEDGINECLHHRCCRLAASFGCDSYCIHSACILKDCQLRREAIMAINDIFRTSKVTVVSDRDLQSVKIIDGSMKELETVLSILLVCDWGVRGWTMLEAIRGSRSLHILCAGD